MARTYATLGADGILTSGQRFTPDTQHAHVHGEQFTGNAVLTQFTLAHTPLYGASVYLAGLRTDVTIVGAVITFSVAPALNALVRVDYSYAP